MAEYLCKEDMNTGEYISKEAFKARIREQQKKCASPDEIAAFTVFSFLLQAVDEEPAADVQPVKHGKWVCNEKLYYNGMTKCSCCNEEYYIEDIQNLQGNLRTVNYCPNCGARMDGEE